MTVVAESLRPQPTRPARGERSWTPRSWLESVVRRRTPVVHQLRGDDCGPSCLAMILAAHGVHGAAVECRALCDAGRDGTRMATIVRVADRFGLTARARSISADALDTISLPAIAYWQSRHFVVIERCTPRRATILDPAYGRRVLSRADLHAGYAGAVIEFQARPDLVRRPRAHVPLWLWYLAAMLRDRAAQSAFAQVIAGSLLLQAAGLAAPAFTKIIVDGVTPRGSALSLGLIAAVMATIVAGKAVTSFLRGLVMIRLQMRLDAHLTQRFFAHLLELPYSFFQGRTSGDLLMRLSSNTMIREILTTQLLSFVLDGPCSLLYLGVIALVSPAFAAVTAALAATHALLAFASLAPLRELGQRTVVAKTDEQSCLVELMKGIAYVKASGTEQRAYDRWRALFRRQLGVFADRSYFTAKIDIALGLLRTASPLLVLWYGAHLVVNDAVPLGTMLALTALAASFITPITSLVQNSQQLQMLESYVERLTDVLQTTPERSAPLPRVPAKGSRRLAGRIDVEGLSYRYSADSPLVVDDISFSLEPGAKLGIVGPTGSGKSTILMLLLGLYAPSAGRILFDGIPLSDLDPREVRRQCGVVLQDSAVFGGSIRSNIELNAPDASLDQVERAAEIAELANDVARLPMRYETRVAEGGSSLSGGQRQRVAIARAVVARPSILLLDEASSHLDVASEARLNANLERLACTRIVVAHRLTAVRTSTEILVLENGRVRERGPHAHLMRLRGAYAALAAAQGAPA